jgi:hypothetical protein
LHYSAVDGADFDRQERYTAGDHLRQAHDFKNQIQATDVEALIDIGEPGAAIADGRKSSNTQFRSRNT